VIICGTPKRDIHVDKIAAETVSAVMSTSGTASIVMFDYYDYCLRFKIGGFVLCTRIDIVTYSLEDGIAEPGEKAIAR
jgi:hypothetical protein